MTQKLQQKKSGEGSVIIYQAPYIKILLDGRQTQTESNEVKNTKTRTSPKISKKISPKTSPKIITETQKGETKETTRNNRQKLEEKILKSSEESTTQEQSRTLKVYGKHTSVSGYRIQLYSGGNDREARKNAYAAGSQFKALYPDIPVYTHFSTPHWRCCVGNFETKQEVQAFMQELKTNPSFKNAVIVKTKIPVAR